MHLQIRHPTTGADGYEPCAPLAPGAQECTLQYFADKGTADQVRATAALLCSHA
jgi:hypothetical protein